MPNFISEDQIERALVQKLQQLHGFDTLNCYTEDPENLRDGSGRAHKREVILIDRVKEAALRLNPYIPLKAIDEALEKLIDRRQALSLVSANREIYNLLRDGVPVEFDNAQGQKQQERVRLIHKFRWPKGKTYPLLSPRNDIIVIVDEAHRTQYKGLAENMRAGSRTLSISPSPARLYSDGIVKRTSGSAITSRNTTSNNPWTMARPCYCSMRSVFLKSSSRMTVSAKNSTKFWRTRVLTMHSKRNWRTGSLRKLRLSNATTGWNESPGTSCITSRDAATLAKAWWSHWTNSPP